MAPLSTVLNLFRRSAKPQQNITLESWLAEAHAHYQEMAKYQAIAFAEVGKPHQEETELGPYVRAIHAQYNNLLIYCHHYLKSRVLILKAKQHLQDLKSIADPQSAEGRELTNTFVNHMEQVMYAQGIERQVESMYDETFAVFIQANVVARNDQNIPICFLGRQPRLDCLFNHVAR